MKIYLVGGSVRDKILKRENCDKDYVVVDSNVQEMQALGFKSVGKSFPVFIHKDKEGEFALARLEKNTGKRHFDFECFTQDVSLRDDLKRRDLSINALAYDEDNDEIIDPYGGLEDIKNKILRPVSSAFCEDPLRVLRAARFRAQLGSEWVFDEKLIEYSQIIKNDLTHLSRERIYAETKKALLSPQPSLFFKSLLELDVLDVIFPWLYNLTKIEHDNKYHLEGVVFNHVMLALDLVEGDINAAWSILFHDLGKYNSFIEDGDFYRHYDEKIVNETFKEIKKTLSLSKVELEVSKFFAINHHNLQKIFYKNMKSAKIARILFGIKSKERLNSLLTACLADMNGRVGEKHEIVLNKDEIMQIYKLLKSADYKVSHQTMNKEKIQSIIAHKQVRILNEFFKGIGK